MKFKTTLLSISVFIIISLLGVNAYFAKDLVHDLKQEDKLNEKKIDDVDTKFTSKIETLEKAVSENKNGVSLVNKDIQYIKEAIDEIKVVTQDINKELKKR